MKQLIFIFLVLPLTWVKAQSVSGVEMSQVGKTVVVEYVLEASEPQEIQLYLSTDGGKTFSKPLQKVSGDVGKGIVPGNKRMVWNVLEEVPELVGDNVVFMVEIAEGLIWEAKNGRPRMEWVSIPAGTFTMGSPSYETGRESNEGPQHSVSLSGFKMSKYEVTFAQYDAFCDATGRQKPSDNGWGRGNRPVVNVDWDAATYFAQWMGCRLPTEAEWEYACRAGTTTPYHTGNSLNSSQANFNENVGKTMPVGSYAPNAWGLYDMHGNVWEWCSDWYGDYSSGAQTNPKGPSSGSFRVVRGGSWSYSYSDGGERYRSASRSWAGGSPTGWDFGFRLVVPIEVDVEVDVDTTLWYENQHVDVDTTVGQEAPMPFEVEIAEGLIWEAKNGRPRMEWVSIPAGTFTMSSTSYEAERYNDEGPQHSVSLSGFKMSKYEVTFAQYDAFCAATGRQKPNDNGWGRGNRPVINVDWHDASAFAQWMGCRLPTEAEWEYACRAGTTTLYHTGNSLNSSQANFYSNVGKTMPVGSYSPNALGLYDMHGNVLEWCSDWYGDYSSNAQTNPKGPSSGYSRVLRGGGWYYFAGDCRSAARNYYVPSYRGNDVGFRLVVPS